MKINSRSGRADAYLPAQIVVNDSDDGEPQKWADTMLCKQILDKLLQHYPGHPWLVQIPPNQGVAIIKHTMLSTLYGMVIHLKDLHSDPSLKIVVRFGGEILERWGQVRGGLRLESIFDAKPLFNDKKLIGRG